MRFLKSLTQSQRSGEEAELPYVLQVEHEDTHKTLLEPLEISRSLRDHVIKHYGQANANPFGKRDVFDKLTEDPMKNPFYDEILNGMLEHQHDLSASHKCFGKHLRLKVSADLAPEAEKMAETMTLIEWRKFFLTAKREQQRAWLADYIEAITKPVQLTISSPQCK